MGLFGQSKKDPKELVCMTVFIIVVVYGCIAYADDIILISGSVTVLQKMLDICVSYGNMLDIVFNAKNLVFFLRWASCTNLRLRI